MAPVTLQSGVTFVATDSSHDGGNQKNATLRRSRAQIGCSARNRQPRSQSVCAHRVAGITVSRSSAAGTLPLWRVRRCDSEGVVRDSDRQASSDHVHFTRGQLRACAARYLSPVPADRIRHMGRALRMTTCTRTSRCTSSSVVLPLLRPLMRLPPFCPCTCPGVPRPDHVASVPTSRPHGAVCNATVLTHAEIVATHYGCVWPLPPSPATSRPTRSATAPSRA